MANKKAILLAGLLALLFGIPVSAQRSEELPSDLENIGIFDRSGAQMPSDLRFARAEGDTIRFGDLFDGEKPVIMNLVYYNCPMLCNLILDGQIAALRQMEWSAGDEFRIVTVSIDPRDRPENAIGRKAHLLGEYDRDGAEAGWDFLTGAEVNVKEVADSAGFYYEFDAERGEFNHAAGIFILTPDGRVSRTLFGIEFDPLTLRLSLVEASEGDIGGTVERVLLYCFSYDAEKGSYAWAAKRIMRAGAGITVVLVFGMILLFGLRERSHRKGTVKGSSS
ncbi:SCO family protein [bacterium]|nr:SCO family protein [bacterium]